MKKLLLSIVFILVLSGCQFFPNISLDISVLDAAIEDVDNFSLHYYYEDDDYYYETNYRFQDDIIEYTYQIESEDETKYFAYDETEGKDYYYYQDNKENWVRVSSGSTTYEEARSYLDYLDLSGIDVTQYTSQANQFIPKEAYLQDAAKAVLGNYDDETVQETYDYFKIKVLNNRIQQITAESNYHDEDGTIHYSYVLTFSSWGTVEITLPELTVIAQRDQMPMSIPSIGDVQGLVVPINFTDYAFTTTELIDLEKAFNGTAAQTGWESVSTYYQKSSYQQLNLSFTLLPTFQTGRNSSYYRGLFNDGGYPEDEIMADILAYYDSSIDYSEYDADNNGEIDAIYLIYAAPVDYDHDSLWWAWVTYFYEDEPATYDGVTANYYMWAGSDFMDDVMNDKGTNWSFDDIYVTVNATTYIHETGHLLGLDDYYDYDLKEGPVGGLGGADMMDMAVGDHSVVSKYLLDWITPTVVLNTQTTTLSSFSSTGEALIIYKDDLSPFSEYIILIYFTPDGLNSITKGYNGLFNTSGVLIYHVDARIEEGIGDSHNDIYDTPFSFNNSTSDHKFIKIIEGDGNDSIENTTYSEYGEYASNSDLFRNGDQLIDYTWYDGTSMSYSIQILSTTSSQAIIYIERNK
ncbi:MAG: hypothetical protein WCQ80_03235 [Bacilli bacterium]